MPTILSPSKDLDSLINQTENSPRAVKVAPQGKPEHNINYNQENNQPHSGAGNSSYPFAMHIRNLVSSQNKGNLCFRMLQAVKTSSESITEQLLKLHHYFQEIGRAKSATPVQGPSVAASVLKSHSCQSHCVLINKSEFFKYPDPERQGINMDS